MASHSPQRPRRPQAQQTNQGMFRSFSISSCDLLFAPRLTLQTLNFKLTPTLTQFKVPFLRRGNLAP